MSALVLSAKRFLFGAVTVVALGCVGPSNAVPILIYNDTATNGTGSYPGDQLETFKVTAAGYAVFTLAAFDSYKNGIVGNVMVGLYDDTAGAVAIAPVNFAGTAYNGTSGSYFDTKALTTPYQLQLNHVYSIEAWGFTGTTGSKTSTTGDGFLFNSSGAVTFNSLSGDLTNIAGSSGTAGNAATNIDGNSTGGLVNALFGNTTAYSSYGAGYPNPCQTSPLTTCTTDGPILRFNGTDVSAAASLTIGPYRVSNSSTPLPGALPLFATGLGALGLLGWRKKRKAQATLAVAD